MFLDDVQRFEVGKGSFLKCIFNGLLDLLFLTTVENPQSSIKLSHSEILLSELALLLLSSGIRRANWHTGPSLALELGVDLADRGVRKDLELWSGEKWNPLLQEDVFDFYLVPPLVELDLVDSVAGVQDAEPVGFEDSSEAVFERLFLVVGKSSGVNSKMKDEGLRFVGEFCFIVEPKGCCCFFLRWTRDLLYLFKGFFGLGGSLNVEQRMVVVGLDGLLLLVRVNLVLELAQKLLFGFFTARMSAAVDHGRVNRDLLSLKRS